MNEEAIIVQEPEHVFLYARNRQEMAAAQERLRIWLDAKVADLKKQRNDLHDAIETAVRNKWAVTPYRSQDSYLKRSVEYYEKVLAAVSAGYTIIPAFWYDCFAVRVQRKKATSLTSSGSEYQIPRIPDQESDKPPLGEGRYVSNESKGYSWDNDEKNSSGTLVKKHYSTATEFREFEFPVVAAKVELMESTAAAMALKCFDELGVSPNRRGKDPLIIGTINGPRKKASFLIAWYFDTRAL